MCPASLQQGSRLPGIGLAAWTPRATARVRQIAAAWATTIASSRSPCARPGRDPEDEVAVERGVHRMDRPGEAGVRDLGEPAGAGLVEREVGGDDGERGVGRPRARGRASSAAA